MKRFRCFYYTSPNEILQGCANKISADVERRTVGDANSGLKWM